MRVTSTTTYLTMREGLGTALSAVADAQAELSSGKRINQLSDAPADAVSVQRYSTQMSDIAAFRTAANDGLKWADTADGALQSISSMLQRVRTLATSAVNGTLNTTARAAIADEVTSLRDQVADVANTKIGNRGLFSGFQDTAVAQVNGTWTYVGDAGAVRRQIGATTSVAVNVTGDDAFGFNAGAGKDLFATLDQLATAIRSGNTNAIATASDQLSARSDDISQSLGTLGAVQNRIQSQLDLGQSTLTELTKQKSDLADIDIAEATLRMQMTSTAYQAALAAASKANLPSLAEFLG
jgi:flagellar hook-associated protein 3 FlgL